MGNSQLYFEYPCHCQNWALEPFTDFARPLIIRVVTIACTAGTTVGYLVEDLCRKNGWRGRGGRPH